MPEVLLEEVGPNGNVQAIVEADDSTCYLYLHFAEETGISEEIKSVWVRNLVPAPEFMDPARMREGLAPLNLANFCKFPQGQPRPKEEDLRFVWLPEGNGVALIENDEIIAMVPPWSGTDGCYGFARDAKEFGPFAWEFDSENALRQRFISAAAYWQAWNGNLWPTMQTQLTNRIEKVLGPHAKYYAIDGGNWPACAILRFSRPEANHLVTIGNCSRPQPNVEMVVKNPEVARRMELGAVLPKAWPDKAVKQFSSYLSAQSKLPWTYYTWLGNGHTIRCDSWRNKKYTAAILCTEHPSLPSIDLGTQFGDPVNLLWFLPITEREREFAIANTSAELLAKLPADRWEDA